MTVMAQLRWFDRGYLIVCFLALVLVALRCAFVPFSHDEVATFYFYVQPGSFLPFISHPDANGHFLMSATSWLCFKLLGSSPFALRLPCIVGLLVLFYAVQRFNHRFSHNITRLIFTSAFILSFNFLGFYALCRGYALSMSFLALAFYYLLEYRTSVKFRHALKFFVFSQLALSANLTLVIVLVILTFLLCLMQLGNKVFFKAGNMLALLLHLGLLFFWTLYAFYLKEAGALYYGGGESYWTVTFESLIGMLSLEMRYTAWVVLALSAMMLFFWLKKLFGIPEMLRQSGTFMISFFTLLACILAFYLLKLLFGVNYPEDRTGLFFYLFFMVALCALIDEFSHELRIIFVFIPLFFVGQLLVRINISNHCWRIYETMPVSFYNLLLDEQSRATRQITIGGHRVREFFYAFLNYNSKTKLNHMTAPEALQMNCDYALAYAQDKPYYDDFYTELAAEDEWGFRLLKRKIPLQRDTITGVKTLLFEGNAEYFNFIEINDTVFTSTDPLQAEADILIESVPVPFNAWLVLQVDGDDRSEIFRTPLNLVAYDHNGLHLKLSNVSGNLPKRIRRLVAYLWNIDRKEIRISVSSFNLYRLHGEGVNVISKAKI